MHLKNADGMCSDRLEQFHMQLGHGLQMAGSSGRDHEDGVLFLFYSHRRKYRNKTSLSNARLLTAADFSITSHPCKKWDKTPLQIPHWIL